MIKSHEFHLDEHVHACENSIFGHNGTELKEECQGHAASFLFSDIQKTTQI